MEDTYLNKGEKFTKVQQKLELLAQSKLQNLSQNTLRKVQDRLVSLEKGVTEQTTANQKIARQYRLLLRKYEQQWSEMQSRCTQTSSDRSRKITELKELMAQYFHKEDHDSKQIYRQGPQAFEEKIERTTKQLHEQVHQRKKQLNQLDERVSENVHKHFQTTDKKVDIKFEELTSNCDSLRQNISSNTETRRKTEGNIMESLKQTVGEIKQILINERVDREKNRDKLCTLLNNAKQTIVIR